MNNYFLQILHSAQKIFISVFIIILIINSLGYVSAKSEEMNDEAVIKRFQQIYYTTKPFNTKFLGILSMQYPSDNWVMQEIICEIKPDFIIEAGTAAGGTALFYATILDQIVPNGKVLTIDILPTLHEAATHFKVWKKHVEFFNGSSTSPIIFNSIAKRVRGKKVLIILDSDHSKKHVLKELQLYAPLVSLKSYIVVQDTQLNGHPIKSFSFNREGPWEALMDFLKTNNKFQIDHSREKHLITQCPSGYLKRIKK